MGLPVTLHRTHDAHRRPEQRRSRRTSDVRRHGIAITTSPDNPTTDNNCPLSLLCGHNSSTTTDNNCLFCADKNCLFCADKNCRFCADKNCPFCADKNCLFCADKNCLFRADTIHLRRRTITVSSVRTRSLFCADKNCLFCPFCANTIHLPSSTRFKSALSHLNVPSCNI